MGVEGGGGAQGCDQASGAGGGSTEALPLTGRLRLRCSGASLLRPQQGDRRHGAPTRLRGCCASKGFGCGKPAPLPPPASSHAAPDMSPHAFTICVGCTRPEPHPTSEASSATLDNPTATRPCDTRERTFTSFSDLADALNVMGLPSGCTSGSARDPFCSAFFRFLFSLSVMIRFIAPMACSRLCCPENPRRAQTNTEVRERRSSGLVASVVV